LEGYHHQRPDTSTAFRIASAAIIKSAGRLEYSRGTALKIKKDQRIAMIRCKSFNAYSYSQG
jgi:hypothetical protein